MLHYRYRPAGELALKELIYDELFLASPAECNDPFDGMAFLAFGPDQDRWKRLVAHAWRGIKLAQNSELARVVAGDAAAHCPMTYRSAVVYDYSSTLAARGLDAALAIFLSKRIQSFLALYQPQPPYFASFSQNSENPIMWSHYSSMHEGHCLIFRDFEGHIEQCPRRRRRSIQRETPKGAVAPSTTLAFPEKFRFETIEYEEHPQPRDAFLCLPQVVHGKAPSEDERRSLFASTRRESLTKHTGWAYESEVRITFTTQVSWLFGEHVELTPLERLLYFRPTQLVGLIVGARMPPDQRARVREICGARLSRLSGSLGKDGIEDPLFDFVIFEARLLDDRRDLAVEPIEVLSLTDSYGRDHASFPDRVAKWRDGWALVFRENGARKQQFA